MKFLKRWSLILLIFITFFISPKVVFAEELSINSKSAILVEVSTGKILYEKNSTQKMYPASTTKIMTAILVLENCNLEDKVTVSPTALENIPTGYVTCNLQVGEELTVENLLYALMVPSANDAAVVLAEHVGGSVEKFASMMNAKALELGCMNTHFVNPNGIHDDAHYSTANDLYLIAKYAMQNEMFRKLVSTTTYTLPATNKYPNADRVLHTSNELINPNNKTYYYEYAVGIKTGHTSEAGNCLVSKAERDGLEFFTVTLGGTQTANGLNARYVDTKKLMNYAYDNYTLTKMKEANTIVTSMEIPNGTKETKNLDLCIQDSITVIHHKDTNMEAISPEIKINENVLAPIDVGDVLGTIKYTVDDVEYTSNLIANSEVIERMDISIYLLGAGILLIVLAILILPKKKHKKKKKTKKRR